MPQNSTHNQLITLLYKEASEEQQQTLLADMLNNENLAEEFSQLMEMKDLLNEAELEPSLTSVSIIMEYSAKSHEVFHA
jgi:hypothetical protein